MKKSGGINRQNILITVYLIILATGITMSYVSKNEYVDVFSMPGTNKVVVIDAGHGGWERVA